MRFPFGARPPARSELLALGSATISIHFEFLQSWLQVTKAHLARQVRELEVFGGGGGGGEPEFSNDQNKAELRVWLGFMPSFLDGGGWVLPWVFTMFHFYV